MLYLFIMTISLFFLSSPILADTLYYKDASQEKGIVVENYHDRIVLNTLDGEKTIKKEDIKDILFDRHEQNLVKLGDFHQQKGNLIRAYGYYKKAVAVNPDYKEAQDKSNYLRLTLMTKPDKQLEDDITRRNAILKESGRIYEPKEKKEALALKERVKQQTGMVLISETAMPKVDVVLSNSPAEKAGIKKGDYVVSIWGKLTGYLEIENIEEMILDSPAAEITLEIKKNIIIPSSNRTFGGVGGLGFFIDIKDEGLFVSSVSRGPVSAQKGLERGDLVVLINNRPTRYMPMQDAVRLIEEPASHDKVELEVVRDVTLWKKT